MFAAVFYLMGFANLGLQTQEPNSSSPGCGLTGMDREESKGEGLPKLQEHERWRISAKESREVVRTLFVWFPCGIWGTSWLARYQARW